jgi:hypothetical protein
VIGSIFGRLLFRLCFIFCWRLPWLNQGRSPLRGSSNEMLPLRIPLFLISHTPTVQNAQQSNTRRHKCRTDLETIPELGFVLPFYHIVYTSRDTITQRAPLLTNAEQRNSPPLCGQWRPRTKEYECPSFYLSTRPCSFTKLSFLTICKVVLPTKPCCHTSTS